MRALSFKKGNWHEQRERLGNVVVEIFAPYAPNFRNILRAQKVITPLDLETVYGLSQGNPNHWEMTLDRFLYTSRSPTNFVGL